MTKSGDDRVVVGSGNPFADLDLHDPEGRRLKARLAGAIYDLLDERGWTQAHAAEVLGVRQPDVSNLMNGRLRNFSLERLLLLLSRLDQRVTISLVDLRGGAATKEIVVRG